MALIVRAYALVREAPAQCLASNPMWRALEYWAASPGVVGVHNYGTIGTNILLHLERNFERNWTGTDRHRFRSKFHTSSFPSSNVMY
jgi:hypothetical protein